MAVLGGPAPDAAEQRSTRTQVDAARWWSIGVPAVAATAVYLVAKDGLTDDALITLSYARTLGLHGSWGMIPGIPANSQTSPLQALLLAGLTAATRSVIVACGLLWVTSVATVGGLVDALARRLGCARWCGVAASLLVGCSPLIVSTIGLETALAAAVIAALTWAVVARGPGTVGVVAGLLVLTRPDLAPIALLGLAATTFGAASRPAARVAAFARAALAGAAVSAPWFLWSWWFLGSAVPDTFAFKAGAGPWHDQLFGGDEYEPVTMANGWELYLTRHPAITVLTMLVVFGGLAGTVALARRPGPARTISIVSGGGAVAYYLTMVVLDAGPHAWYYAPSVAGLIVTLVLAAGRARARWAAGAVGVLVAVTVLATFARVTPWPAAPVGGNYATAAQYAAVTRGLPAANVAAPGEIGTLVFYCDGRCRVLDGFSDQGAGANTIRHQVERATGVKGWLLRLNYARYRPPPPQPVVGVLWFRDGANPRPAGPAIARWAIDSRWHPGGEISLHPGTDSPWD